MCEGCVPIVSGPDPMFPNVEWPEEGAKVKYEDPRATKPHQVSVTIVVQAEDARKAVEKVLSSYEGTGIEVTQVSASRSYNDYNDDGYYG